MHRRRSLAILLCIPLLVLAACGRAEPAATAPEPAPTVPGVVSSDGQVVAPATADAAPGQVNPAPGALTPAAPASEDGMQQLGPLTQYTDANYRFRLAYPEQFTLRPLTAEALAQLDPAPLTALAILSPVRAASALGDAELPDLELRVYPADGAPSLEAWLNARGLVAGPVAPAYRTAGALGFELCGDTMLAPGCSYYFLGDGFVFQLIPASLEGEAILKSFSLN